MLPNNGKHVPYIQNRMRSFSSWLKNNPTELNMLKNRTKVNKLISNINESRWNNIEFNNNRPIEIFFPMTLREINKSAFEIPSERFKTLIKMGYLPSRRSNADFGPGMYSSPYYSFMTKRKNNPVIPEPKLISNMTNTLYNNKPIVTPLTSVNSIGPTKLKNNALQNPESLSNSYINSVKGNQIPINIQSLIRILNESDAAIDQYKGNSEFDCTHIKNILQKMIEKTTMKCGNAIIQNNTLSNNNKNKIMKRNYNINKPNYKSQLIILRGYYLF